MDLSPTTPSPLLWDFDLLAPTCEHFFWGAPAPCGQPLGEQHSPTPHVVRVPHGPGKSPQVSPSPDMDLGLSALSLGGHSWLSTLREASWYHLGVLP